MQCRIFDVPAKLEQPAAATYCVYQVSHVAQCIDMPHPAAARMQPAACQLAAKYNALPTFKFSTSLACPMEADYFYYLKGRKEIIIMMNAFFHIFVFCFFLCVQPVELTYACAQIVC